MATKVIEREDVNLSELHDIFNTVFTSYIDEERDLIGINDKESWIGCMIDETRSLIQFFMFHRIKNDVPPYQCIAFVNQWNLDKIFVKTIYKEEQDNDARFIAVEYDILFDRGIIPYNLIKTVKWLQEMDRCLVDESLKAGINLKNFPE